MSATPLPRLPYHFARQHGVCVETTDTLATLIYTDNTQAQALAEIRRFLGRPLLCRHLRRDDFEEALTRAYAHESGDAQRIADDAGESFSLAQAAGSVGIAGDLLAQEDDAPVIRLINALLMEALRENASDVHIETFERALVIRLRVDGVLHETLRLNPSLAPLLLSRIKVMAKLDIAEKRLPQDGRITLRIGGRDVDVRVSLMPANDGERAVLRLLDKQAGRLDLAQLGFTAASRLLIENLIRKPHGILLVTGPTGSGKTTSLYAMITRLNDRSRNILTVEDPVEYQIEGIGQTQVNARVDLTFARGLRAILRQDPDVVMIGEIRDVETAGIAVQASLTGHLVLSTLHTNSASGAITRLTDMGVEPFLLSSSLIGLMAQRLVRALCDQCKSPARADTRECEYLGVPYDSAPTLYRAKGCPACRGSGYRGRRGIYEVIPIDDTLRRMIHAREGEHAIEAYARSLTPGIGEDGAQKILDGVTTCEEVMRVTSE